MARSRIWLIVAILSFLMATPFFTFCGIQSLKFQDQVDRRMETIISTDQTKTIRKEMGKIIDFLGDYGFNKDYTDPIDGRAWYAEAVDLYQLPNQTLSTRIMELFTDSNKAGQVRIITPSCFRFNLTTKPLFAVWFLASLILVASGLCSTEKYWKWCRLESYKKIHILDT